MNRPPEWYEDRKKQLGASEVAAILGLSRYTSPFEVWAVKTGRLQPFEGNEATRIGQRLEPLILDDAEADLGKLERDVEVDHGGIPLRATLDGAVAASGEVVECKTAGFTGPLSSDWGDEGLVEVEGQIPVAYYVQIQSQLLCTKSELAHLYAWLAGRGMARYKVVPDAPLFGVIEERVAAWWKTHIVEGVAPPMTGTPLKVLSKLSRNEETIELPPEIGALLDRRDVEKAAASAAKKQLDDLDAQIIQALGDADTGVLPDGRKITYRQTTRKGYEVKETTYRTLRIKKAK